MRPTVRLEESSRSAVSVLPRRLSEGKLKRKHSASLITAITANQVKCGVATTAAQTGRSGGPAAQKAKPTMTLTDLANDSEFEYK